MSQTTSPNKKRVFYTKAGIISFFEKKYPGVDWRSACKDAPPVLPRSRWDYYAEKYGWPCSKGYMQNLDSKGIGPTSYA